MKNPRLRLKYICDENMERLKEVQNEWHLSDDCLIPVSKIDDIFNDPG